MHALHPSFFRLVLRYQKELKTVHQDNQAQKIESGSKNVGNTLCLPPSLSELKEPKYVGAEKS